MSKMSGYEEPVPNPQDFLDVVLEDEDEDEIDGDDVEDDYFDLEEMEMYSALDDGGLMPSRPLLSLVPLQSLLQDPTKLSGNFGNLDDGGDFGNGNADATLTSDADPGNERLSSDSEDDDDARQSLLRVSTPVYPVAAFPPAPPVSAARGCGRVPRRGRGRRVNQGGRGLPLLQKFQSDADLPRELTRELSRLQAARGSREVASEARDTCKNEEQEFNGCEGFTWRPMEGWQGRKEQYQPRRPPGPTATYASPYDALRAYWDDDIVSHIATATNHYAESIASTNAKFCREWVKTNLDEIWCLFAFWMMLGIINMPSVKSCFSSAALLYTSGFRKLFTENRYWQLNRAFHLSRARSDDPLAPMGPVLEHLQRAFQDRYEPEQNICIDESVTLWKGHVSFKQYFKTKARFGMKTYELCESSTGYMHSFFVYIGRRTTSSPLPSSVSTVLKLMRPRLDLGHVLYMDNWFNSPQLARYLKRRRTDCVGTLRANRKNVPGIIQVATLAEGEFVARQSGDVVVMALADRKRTGLISTCHGTEQVQTSSKPGRPSHYRLALVADYNSGMGGVDLMDQMLDAYLLERKQCRNWVKKLFKRFLNVSIQNARILLEKSSGRKFDSLEFRLSLVQSILDRHRPNVPMPRKRAAPRPNGRASCPGSGVGSGSSEKPARLTERHFCERIPVTDEDRARIKYPKNLGRAYCEWCKWCGRHAKTYYECPDCNVPLCGGDKKCFKLYHTLEVPRAEHKTSK